MSTHALHPPASGHTAPPAPDAVPASVPLYVDLDGTLIAGDTLQESLLRLAHQSPFRVVALVPALLRSRAAFKAALADRVVPELATLALNDAVLGYVRNQRARGRRVVLATASHEKAARAVADALGVFDAVLATHGDLNCKGAVKRDAICADADGAFEYVGDSSADLPIWEAAERATLVRPSASLRASAERVAPGRTRVLVEAPARLGLAVRALRPHQWVKNVLLFVPLLLAHQASDLMRLRSVLLSFASFCLIASATYVLNDLLDLEADRRHPTKRHRPFASGRLPLAWGIGIVPLLLAAGFGVGALFLTPSTTGMLLIYAAVTMAYSFRLKEQLFIDVLVLAGLYTHRVLTGGVAAGVVVSPWLLAFSMFFFLSLAFVKRTIELMSAEERSEDQLARRGYEIGDLQLVQTMGLTSGYVSVLVLCLYVSSDAVQPLYSRPELLWSMVPIMLYWITRVWFLVRRGEVAEDPVLFAATDRTSYVAGALLLMVVMLAARL